jgi:hypothetical protein
MIPRVSYRHNLFIVSEVYIGSIGPKSLRFRQPLTLAKRTVTPRELASGGCNGPRKEIMTTDADRPVGDKQNSLTAGRSGPVAFEDASKAGGPVSTGSTAERKD